MAVQVSISAVYPPMQVMQKARIPVSGVLTRFKAFSMALSCAVKRLSCGRVSDRP